MWGTPKWSRRIVTPCLGVSVRSISLPEGGTKLSDLKYWLRPGSVRLGRSDAGSERYISSWSEVWGGSWPGNPVDGLALVPWPAGRMLRKRPGSSGTDDPTAPPAEVAETTTASKAARNRETPRLMEAEN